MSNSDSPNPRKTLKAVEKEEVRPNDLRPIKPQRVPVSSSSLSAQNKQVNTKANQANSMRRKTAQREQATKTRRPSQKQVAKQKMKQYKNAPDDEVLAVLLDQKNGHIFYVSVIDSFRYNGINYAIMYNYQAGQTVGTKPEILIMRTYRDGEKQYFTSIRDKTELNTIFEVFYSRFERSL